MSRKREYHGMTGTSARSAWKNMKSRCSNKKIRNFKDYGGRGITICDDWFNSFISYYNFVSKLPNYGVEGYTLDRIDNDGNYEPTNVKYSTKSEQNSNRRGFGTSKFKGVCWDKQKNKWRSTKWVNGKTKYIGLFTSETEASNAYLNYTK